MTDEAFLFEAPPNSCLLRLSVFLVIRQNALFFIAAATKKGSAHRKLSKLSTFT